MGLNECSRRTAQLAVSQTCQDGLIVLDDGHRRLPWGCKLAAGSRRRQNLLHGERSPRRGEGSGSQIVLSAPVGELARAFHQRNILHQVRFISEMVGGNSPCLGAECDDYILP